MIFGTEYFCFLNNFRKSKSSEFEESRNNLATVAIQKKTCKLTHFVDLDQMLLIDKVCQFRLNVIK